MRAIARGCQRILEEVFSLTLHGRRGRFLWHRPSQGAWRSRKRCRMLINVLYICGKGALYVA